MSRAQVWLWLGCCHVDKGVGAARLAFVHRRLASRGQQTRAFPRLLWRPKAAGWGTTKHLLT